MNACGDSRLRGLRSRKPIGFRQWVVHGNITEAKLKKLKAELRKVCHVDEHSVVIYRFETLKYSSREIIGVHKEENNFL